MSETLYAILRNGNILPISGVTALALDNTLTIKPGDNYQNKWVAQTTGTGSFGDVVLTNEQGDNVSATAPKTESWLCSYWKFTRGADLPILRLRWVDVEAICDSYPNRAVSGAALYIPLRSGKIAVITGIAASTTAVIPNTSLTVYPGDYYRFSYLAQTHGAGSFGDVVLTNQLGDANTTAALHSETFDVSHLEFTRTGLLSLYIPERHAMAGVCTSYPNRVAA